MLYIFPKTHHSLFPPVGETFVLRTSVTQLQGTRQQGALYYVGVKYLYDKLILSAAAENTVPTYINQKLIHPLFKNQI